MLEHVGKYMNLDSYLLPLIPIFARLSALKSLAGGARTIAVTMVNTKMQVINELRLVDIIKRLINLGRKVLVSI